MCSLPLTHTRAHNRQSAMEIKKSGCWGKKNQSKTPTFLWAWEALLRVRVTYIKYLFAYLQAGDACPGKKIQLKSPLATSGSGNLPNLSYNTLFKIQTKAGYRPTVIMLQNRNLVRQCFVLQEQKLPKCFDLFELLEWHSFKPSYGNTVFVTVFFFLIFLCISISFQTHLRWQSDRNHLRVLEGVKIAPNGMR